MSADTRRAIINAAIPRLIDPHARVRVDALDAVQDALAEDIASETDTPSNCAALGVIWGMALESSINHARYMRNLENS